jgi:hypothetical protein
VQQLVCVYNAVEGLLVLARGRGKVTRHQFFVLFLELLYNHQWPATMIGAPLKRGMNLEAFKFALYLIGKSFALFDEAVQVAYNSTASIYLHVPIPNSSSGSDCGLQFAEQRASSS